MRRYSVKTKMTALAAAIVLGTTALLLAAVFFLAEPVMIAGQKRDIMTLYRSLEEQYSDSALHTLLAGYERENYFQVEIFDESGTLLYTSGRKMEEGFGGFGDQPPLPSVGKPTVGNDYQKDPKVEYRTFGEREMLSVRGIMEAAGGSTRYVSIETPVEGISETVETIQSLILFICIFAALLGCGAAFLFGRHFSRPIIRIADTAKRVAALDFSCPADEQSSTAEIGELAGSINIMSRRLSDFIHELMVKNQKLKEDNDRLLQAEEMRRSFVANVSHDLKSPLAVLGGYAEMLKEHTEGITPEECYDIIIEETNTMNAMIRSMLDVSAIENGLKSLTLTPIDGRALMEELLQRERPLLEKRGIRAEESLCGPLPILADGDYLTRALMNILQNAVSHTRPEGCIRIETYTDGEEAVFAVYNEGEGIPEEKQQKIWDSFYKTDEARTRKGEPNVGLGLYIVKTVVTAHGGRCTVANEREGVTFRIFLPIGKE